ncbi:conserved hypothetical protein [Theileria equi strain WA]|uniref:Uncharacterized protein n=1 Tax=Theileria equi strain WA TaxID=1537102 RepID=L1LFJ0_THEEQ|nr:conserved hypothetical protein [Theileria equi strain WA]EKX73918.1 conserved hypothetical protein [Theileria equi strain WA]|eukprot:XP_004833370.1 conserved hypothetical protein [Theileria equi strain WA]
MFRRRWGNISRTILLRGSPANRVAQWSLTILISAIWIYKSEKANPRNRGIFFRDNKAQAFTLDEVEEWNAKFKSSGQK